jgi:hypothetical protein
MTVTPARAWLVLAVLCGSPRLIGENLKMGDFSKDMELGRR